MEFNYDVIVEDCMMLIEQVQVFLDGSFMFIELMVLVWVSQVGQWVLIDNDLKIFKLGLFVLKVLMGDVVFGGGCNDIFVWIQILMGFWLMEILLFGDLLMLMVDGVMVMYFDVFFDVDLQLIVIVQGMSEVLVINILVVVINLELVLVDFEVDVLSVKLVVDGIVIVMIKDGLKVIVMMLVWWDLLNGLDVLGFVGQINF